MMRISVFLRDCGQRAFGRASAASPLRRSLHPRFLPPRTLVQVLLGNASVWGVAAAVLRLTLPLRRLKEEVVEPSSLALLPWVLL